MRRGGGSRRSSSRRSSRRSYNSSRRRGYYGGGHYGRRPYGGYYGGGYYRRRSLGPTGTLVMISFFMFFIVQAVSLVIGTPNTTSYNLEPNMTIAKDISSSLRNGVSMRTTLGSGAIAYFFEEEPPLSMTISSSENYTEILYSSDFTSSYTFLNDGSTATISWTADDSIKLWIIKGESKYNSWEEGSDVSAETEVGSNGNLVYTIHGSDTYYFVFENPYSQTTRVNVQIDLEMKTHDISSAKASQTGDFGELPIEYSFIVIQNPTNITIKVEITLYPVYSFGLVFFVIILILFLPMIALFKKMKSSEIKRKELAMKNPATTPGQMNSQSYPRPSNTSVFSNPNPSGFYQRPKPMYCAACGSATLPNSKFCTTCGTKT